MADISIRQATIEDAEALHILVRQHAEFENEPFADTGPAAQPDIADFVGYLFDASNPIRCFVVEDAGRVLGYTTFVLQQSTWRARPYLFMDCLFLIESSRGRGLGRAVMDRVRAEALQLGCDQIRWHTPSDNVRAIRFYDRLGTTSTSKCQFTWQIDGREQCVSATQASEPRGLPDNPYHPRPIHLSRVRECNGWQLKMYEITPTGQPIASAVTEGAITVFQQKVVWPCEVADRYGFAIVHVGAEAVWALAKIWVNDILRQFAFQALLAEPTKFTASPLPGFNACVWELEVTHHERDAWVRHVLCAPRKPDFEGYLRDYLAVPAP